MEIRKPKGVGKYLGLMFRTRKARPVLFEFKESLFRSIHTFFVFQKLIVVWIFEDGDVELMVVEPFYYNIEPETNKKIKAIFEAPYDEDLLNVLEEMIE